MKAADEQYSVEETVRRRDAAIRRALNTPPSPHKDMIGRVGRAQKKRDTRKSRPRNKQKDQP